MTVPPEMARETLRARRARRDAELASRAAEATAAARSVVGDPRWRGAALWLFGSLAWGGFHETSDVDVAIEGLEPDEADRLREALERAPRMPVDLLRLEAIRSRSRSASAPRGCRWDERRPRQDLAPHRGPRSRASRAARPRRGARAGRAEARRRGCGRRPALIGEDERLWLQGLRGFRHFFRNAYSAELAPAELHRHALAVIAPHPALARGLDDFVAFPEGLRR